MDELSIPAVRRAPRTVTGKLGYFVESVGYDGFAQYLPAYRAAMAVLPPVGAVFDVPTSFGSVRAYRFDGPDGAGAPVVLLPGRNAATPMWRANLPALVAKRTVYSVDLLGEPGLSVQDAPITSAQQQAQWLDETLTGLELVRPHVLGASIGGWLAANHSARYPGRAASLTLLDPVMTFGRIPLRTLAISGLMVTPATPNAIRRRILRWIGGGVAFDLGTADFVIRLPPPKQLTDDELRSLDLPVLAIIAGRSVMVGAQRAAAKAREVLPHGRVELWPDASHAITGEYTDRISEHAHRFWDDVG
jgi:pimeloyl-ACP methyl ester carboxylesterase